MRLPGPRDNRVRTIGVLNLVVLNESVIHEWLNDLLYRLGNCSLSSESEAIRQIVSRVLGTYTLHLWAQLELLENVMRSTVPCDQ